MKNSLTTFLLLLMVAAFTPASAVVHVVSPQEALAPGFSIEEFVTATPKEIREKTGHKLSLKETVVLKAAQRKLKKEMKGDAAAGSKSQLIALLLVILVGTLGIHRFYLGYTTYGIIQLLTLGACGIWTLIDLIRIITGDLQPADGSPYNPTL